MTSRDGSFFAVWLRRSLRSRPPQPPRVVPSALRSSLARPAGFAGIPHAPPLRSPRLPRHRTTTAPHHYRHRDSYHLGTAPRLHRLPTAPRPRPPPDSNATTSAPRPPQQRTHYSSAPTAISTTTTPAPRPRPRQQRTHYSTTPTAPQPRPLPDSTTTSATPRQHSPATVRQTVCLAATGTVIRS